MVDNSTDSNARHGATPTLPPVAGASGSSRTADQRARARREAPQRQQFLSGLLNEDLQALSKWHGTRPAHEQKRFLKSVDALYKAFSDAEHGAGPPVPSQAQLQAKAAAQAAARSASAFAEDDPLDGPPRETPRGQLNSSVSAPSLPSRPIDVFEQRKRSRRRATGEEDPNSLQRWIETQSLSSGTTGTTSASRLTSFTQLTQTSSGSFCSEPGTTNQAAYRIHRRAAAANRQAGIADQHNAGYLKDGIPNYGFPEYERMQSTFKEAFGYRPLGENVSKGMYESVFQNGHHPFVEKFLENAPSDQRENFAGMVRSLQYLRRAAVRDNTSLQRQEYDIEENSRLHKPPRAKPIFTSEQLNHSQVPIGTRLAGKNSKVIPPTPPSSAPVPPSPSVSNLGSMPLTRMSTPLVT